MIYTIATLCISFALGLLSGAFQSRGAYVAILPLTQQHVKVSDVRNRTQESLRRVGATNTYALMKKLFATEIPSHSIHSVMHIVGEELYTFYGLSGVRTCDDAFLFACYHGFFTRALSERGLSIMDQLQIACLRNKKEDQGCMHGLGHGILAYLGNKSFTEASRVCWNVSTSKTNGINGCIGGVTMEYDLENTDDARVWNPRPLTPQGYFVPCSLLPANESPSCYFQHVQWWERIVRDFSTIGKLCNTISDIESQRQCFRGIGNIAAGKDYSFENIINRCSQMPTQEGNNQCRIGAAWSYMLSPYDKSRYRELCPQEQQYRAMCP